MDPLNPNIIIPFVRANTSRVVSVYHSYPSLEIMRSIKKYIISGLNIFCKSIIYFYQLKHKIETEKKPLWLNIHMAKLISPMETVSIIYD